MGESVYFVVPIIFEGNTDHKSEAHLSRQSKLLVFAIKLSFPLLSKIKPLISSYPIFYFIFLSEFFCCCNIAKLLWSLIGALDRECVTRCLTLIFLKTYLGDTLTNVITANIIITNIQSEIVRRDKRQKGQTSEAINVSSRAGNSLIGFLSESLIFCEKMSEWAIR